MSKPLSMIERAFELARSGSCRNPADLEAHLKREGYTSVHQHLMGSASLRKQLNDLCKLHSARLR